MTLFKKMSRKLLKMAIIIFSSSLVYTIGDSNFDVSFLNSQLFAQESIAIPDDMSDKIEFLSRSKDVIDEWFSEIAEVDSIKMIEAMALIDSLYAATERGDSLKSRVLIPELYAVITEAADYSLGILEDIYFRGEEIRSQSSELSNKLESFHFGDAKRHQHERYEELRTERLKRLTSIGAVADLANRMNHVDPAYSTEISLQEDLERMIGILELDGALTSMLNDMIENKRWSDLEMMSSRLLDQGSMLENIYQYEDYGIAISMVASAGIAYLRDMIPRLMANSELVRDYGGLIANLGTLPKAPSSLVSEVDIISGTGFFGFKDGGVLDKLVQYLNDTNGRIEDESARLTHNPKILVNEANKVKSSNNDKIRKMINDGMKARQELSKRGGDN